MRRRTWTAILGALCVAAAVGACGSRTGLDADAVDFVDVPDAPFVSMDRVVPRDALRDVSFDTLPRIDARPLPDVQRNDCPDADSTLVYVVTEENDIYSFFPSAMAFTRIGRLTCPASAGSTPFSMAVDRKGKAYVVYNDGRLYQVSTLTGACIATPFVPSQQGITTFGMGFASNNNGPAETLYIASDATGSSSVLGSIDTTTFRLNFVGPFNPTISRAELTGTGDGRLFGFYQVGTGTMGSAIAQIDKQTGNITAVSPLPNVSQGTAWAFAFWGGDFYTFTSPGTSSTVTRFRPSDGTVTDVASLGANIVGAGVSTCAPEQ